MAGTNAPSNAHEGGENPTAAAATEEHFKPTGTLFIIVLFVVALILLWGSVYVILLSRGVTT